MDPNLNFNSYPYSDNYSGTGATGDTNDSSQQFGWASQWTQPASATSQGGAGGVRKFQYPQYVSQHQQQAQQQAQQAYAMMNPLSPFMQSQQKPQQQQLQLQQQFQQQKKFGQHGPVGTPKAPGSQLGGASNPRAFGAFGAVGGGGDRSTSSGGILGQEWTGGAGNQFGMQSHLRTFPSKSGGPGGPGNMHSKPNWRQQKQQRQSGPPAPKKTETAGKTPAMILHEVFKSITEDYSEVEGAVPKRYICTLTVNGRQFQMESNNKKAAKQKCAEAVVRELRPDLHVTPFEEGVTAKATPPAPPKSAAGNGQPNKRNAEDQTNQPAAKKTAVPGVVKKIKLTPVESAQSLLDFMQKTIAESKEKYTPVFEAIELPRAEEMVEVKTEDIKEEVTDVPAADENANAEGATKKSKKERIRKPEVLHQVTLKFLEQGKEFTKTGPNRGMLKDMLIREALREVFNVPQEAITIVARRHALNRLGTDMNLVQCLQTIAGVLNCKVSLETEPAEDRPIGDGKMYFMGRAKIIDLNEDGKEFETKSTSVPSKALAREHAAMEMLKQYFKMDTDSIQTNEANGHSNAQQGPCAVLHAMMNKATKQQTKILYEFKDNVPPVAGAGSPGPVFYCDCVIDEERFTGSGRSKKLAKNAAAVVALKRKFSVDYNPDGMCPLAHSSRPERQCSPLCREISEFCKREYYDMTRHYGVNQSNQIACFVLINDKNEKRILSIGSSIQYVCEPDSLTGADGNHIVHMDPIVLARRGLIRSIYHELLYMPPEGSVVFEKQPDGRYALNKTMKLVLYSNFSPACRFSCDDVPKKSLSYVTPLTCKPVPEDVLTLDEIRAKREIRIHSTADKLFKWNHLGVQGALLSHVLHPLFISHIFFGTQAPVPDDSLKFALVNRIGPVDAGADHQETELESVQGHMDVFTTRYSHVWSRGLDLIEQLDVSTGRTINGMPSSVCKAQLFANYCQLPHVTQNDLNYGKEKEASSNYQYEKKVLYEKLEAAGLGKWQTKPMELVDSFTLPASFN
ncbi:hypothetical protein B9Z55_000244 [Caenorhabditis nigoni]|uniref:Uncharacterized protein n=1 Tax=Caenorhabditis nigoni TaxID=1611254 RepID=A0A2G5VKQ4_9PELO|nr:hypothetical protein B9Z55_000244 [Caenorhabditis nigoni]